MRRRVAVLAATDNFASEFTRLLGGIADVEVIRTPAHLMRAMEPDVEFDYVFAAHWRRFVPPQVLSAWRCIRFHTSRLPERRGGSPIQNQIARGSYQSEVAAFSMTSDLDAGPVYRRRPIDLGHGALHENLYNVAELTAGMALEILQQSPVLKPQSGPVSKFERRDPSESALTLTHVSICQVYDHFRMLDGLDYPRAFVDVGGYQTEFVNATFEGDVVLAQARFSLRRGE